MAMSLEANAGEEEGAANVGQYEGARRRKVGVAIEGRVRNARREEEGAIGEYRQGAGGVRAQASIQVRAQASLGWCDTIGESTGISAGDGTIAGDLDVATQA